jgi:hypothetical protein
MHDICKIKEQPQLLIAFQVYSYFACVIINADKLGPMTDGDYLAVCEHTAHITDHIGK